MENVKVKEEFDLEVVLGNADLYDDIFTEEALKRSLSVAESTSVTPPKPIRKTYPLSLDTKKEPVQVELIQLPRPESPRFECLIGNLTWWTTDADIKSAIEAVGVFDILDITFSESRVNGVSHGFCTCTVKTDGSLKLIHENLIHEEVHGKRPLVMHNTKDAVAYFESQNMFRPKPKAPTAKPEEDKENAMISAAGVPTHKPLPRFYAPGFNYGGPNFPARFPHHGYVHGFRSYAPSFRYRGGLYSGYRGPRLVVSNSASCRSWYEPRPQVDPKPGYFTSPEQRPPAQKPFMSPPISPPGNSSPMLSGHFPAPQAASSPVGLFEPMLQPQLRFTPIGLFESPPQQQLQPQPHFNPEFLCRKKLPGLIPITVQPVAERLPARNEVSTTMLSPEEYQDAMNKVKVVASTAMARAVKDSASGDYSDSIETLVTAISLLRQSKVVNDNGVKMLIASLQDTLENVECKSYSRNDRRVDNHSRHRHQHHREHRSRTRSRSPQRSSRRYSTAHTHGDYVRGHERDEYVPRMKPRYRSRSPRYSEQNRRHGVSRRC